MGFADKNVPLISSLNIYRYIHIEREHNTDDKLIDHLFIFVTNIEMLDTVEVLRIKKNGPYFHKLTG